MKSTSKLFFRFDCLCANVLFFRSSYNFPADRYRSYDESLRNVSLSLVNSHFSSGLIRPYVPNLVEIGGIQVKPKPSPLPEVSELSLLSR